jgi:hypothetical protein
MPALADEQGPSSTDPTPVECVTISVFAVAVFVVSVIQTPRRGFDAKNMVHDLEGIPNPRIVSIAQSQAYEVREIHADQRGGRNRLTIPIPERNAAARLAER